MLTAAGWQRLPYPGSLLYELEISESEEVLGLLTRLSMLNEEEIWKMIKSNLEWYLTNYLQEMK